MGRFVLIAIAIVAAFLIVDNHVVLDEGLKGHIWLVAMFPAIYILGLCLLKD